MFLVEIYENVVLIQSSRVNQAVEILVIFVGEFLDLIIIKILEVDSHWRKFDGHKVYYD
jgi:hypothetical protein